MNIVEVPYTLSEYIHRRGSLLSVHRNHSHLGRGCMALAERQARLVYKQEQQRPLFAWEINALETEVGFSPALLIPPNMTSIPAESIESPADRIERSPFSAQPNMISKPTNDEQNLSRYPTSHEPTEHALKNTRETPMGILTPGNIVHASQGQEDLSDHKSNLDGADAMTNNAAALPIESVGIQQLEGNLDTNAAKSQHTISDNSFLTQIVPPEPAKHSPSAKKPQIHIPHNTELKVSGDQQMFASTATVEPAPPDSKQAGVPNIAKPEDGTRSIGTSQLDQEPKALFTAHGVSALAGRAIHVPIKHSREKRSAAMKRSAQDVDHSEPESSVEEETRRPGTKRRAFAQGEPAASSTSRTAKNRQQSESVTIDAVMSGEALPANRQQAVAAARERRIRLSIKQKTKGPRGQARLKKNVKTPNMEPMPEFFDSITYGVKERTEGFVRCICGVIADDGESMISCDTCSVWQHNACMGSAVPEDAETGEYRCQVCDPWSHRELLQRLRQDQVL